MKVVVLSAWLSRIVAALAMVYALRVLSRALSAPDYAVFIILAGLMAWFALSDMGLGYAAQNAVTKRLARDEEPADEIMSAYAMVLVTAGAVLVALTVLKQPIAHLLFAKVAASTGESHTEAFWRAGVLMTLGAVATMSTKILYAEHRGHVANLSAAGCSVLGVLLLMAGVDSADDKVTYAFLALYGPNVAVCLLFCGAQILQARRSPRRTGLSHAAPLLRASRGFFLFYFMAAAVLQVDYLVMSQKVVANEVVLYYSVAKIFSFVTFLNQAVLFAAWPRMTAAFSTGDRAPIARLLRRLVVGGAAVAVLATLLVLATRHVLAGFLAPGTTVEFRVPVILGFGALALMRSIVDPFAILLQSIGKLKPLIVFAALQAVIGGGLQWLLADRWGIEGILAALVTSFLVTVAWGLPWTTRRALQT